MKIVRKLATAAVLAAPLALVGMAGPASAHVPGAKADCDGLTFKATKYNSHADNTVTVKIDDAVVSGWDAKKFGKDVDGAVAIPQDAKTHTWAVIIVTSEDPTGSHGWTKTESGSVGPCGETPTPSTPPTTEEPTTPPPTTAVPTTPPAMETPTPSETVTGPPVQTDFVNDGSANLVPLAAAGAFASVTAAGAFVARRRTRR
ncbi:hypothetical protein [Luteipulveratus mongoliensis]|uniref:Gram-positive cocci surface proteins LPxTG domain-containing protein n=1 Tax=Luteipulveratus mongoliensis TaxID=571913 RepID=A0A0K1JE59_9MICO|nr:hypothetical protein [Luteipulveratus mongoliensis]AKU15002.1 hypothetical protein VV02_02545 [Luteipulveratus mongoliensis]